MEEFFEQYPQYEKPLSALVLIASVLFSGRIWYSKKNARKVKPMDENMEARNKYGFGSEAQMISKRFPDNPSGDLDEDNDVAKFFDL